MWYFCVIDQDDRLKFVTDNLKIHDLELPVKIKSVHVNRSLVLALDFNGNIWRCTVSLYDKITLPFRDTQIVLSDFVQMSNIHGVTRIMTNPLHEINYYVITEDNHVLESCCNQWYIKEKYGIFRRSMCYILGSTELPDDVLSILPLELPMIKDNIVIQRIVRLGIDYLILDSIGQLWYGPTKDDFTIKERDVEDLIVSFGIGFYEVYITRRVSGELSFSQFTSFRPGNIPSPPIMYLDRQRQVIHEISDGNYDKSPIAAENIVDLQRHGQITILLLDDGTVLVRYPPGDVFHVVPELRAKRLLNCTDNNPVFNRTKNARSSL